MPMVAAGIMNADTFENATATAAFGGTTTVIPFAAQHIGMKLRQVRPRIGLRHLRRDFVRAAATTGQKADEIPLAKVHLLAYHLHANGFGFTCPWPMNGRHHGITGRTSWIAGPY